MVDDESRLRLEGAYVALRRFAAVVGPGTVEPDDLVQEAFVRVLRRGVADVSDLDAYLRRVVLNLAANEARRIGRRRRLAGLLPSRGDTEESYFSDVGDLLRLPPDVRAVLWLSEVEGWPYREIAKLVGCSADAARARASRARRALRAALEGES